MNVTSWRLLFKNQNGAQWLIDRGGIRKNSRWQGLCDVFKANLALNGGAGEVGQKFVVD